MVVATVRMNEVATEAVATAERIETQGLKWDGGEAEGLLCTILNAQN
jgi:hypothetical protein